MRIGPDVVLGAGVRAGRRRGGAGGVVLVASAGQNPEPRTRLEAPRCEGERPWCFWNVLTTLLAAGPDFGCSTQPIWHDPSLTGSALP